MRRPGEPPSLQYLVRLDDNNWMELVSKHGIPQNVPGSSFQEKATTYVSQLRQMIEEAFPTSAIAARLEKDNKDDSPFTQMKADLGTFFSNSPTFDFHKTVIDEYLSKNRDTALVGVTDEEALTRQLKKMQRVFKLTPRYEEMRALLADGLHSAQAITRLGRGAFVENYAELFGTRQQADLVYAKAESIHDMALTLYAKHSAATNAVEPYVISGVTNGTTSLRNLIESNRPDLRTLFGSLDSCDCEHCHSVYSPAAYLVDMLQYLKHCQKKDGQKTPLQVLFNRRPDIEVLELTCENTNTLMPYIDLTLEVLEEAIAPQNPPFYPQVSGTPEDLSANPEHVNQKAYDTLATTVYPWNLPLNLWVEEARVYLDHLGVHRYKVMETCFSGTLSAAMNDDAIVREYLGSTSKEAAIITGTATEPTWEFWGLQQENNSIADPADGRTPPATGDWDIVLKRVSVFL